MTDYSKKELNGDINYYITELDSYKSDFKKLRNCKDSEEFFGYFKKKYGFKLQKNNKKNSMKLFQELNVFMGWSNFFSEQKKFFKDLTEKNKKIYLEKFYKKYNLFYSDEFSLKESFEYLGEETLNVNKIAKQFIYKFLGEKVEGKFEKLEDLKKIIKKYNLTKPDKIPNKLEECEEIIQEKLFVNIYDFIEGNNIRRFRTLEKLAKYSIENDYIYPLGEAKKTFIYKVLLREIMWYRSR